MSHISRRKVVKGAAWATPVIAASAVVPVFASSLDCTFAENAFVSARGMSNYERVEEEFTIPAGTHKLRFELTGGAGGRYEKGLDGGSGAKVSGIVEVKPHQTVKIIAGGGGSFGPQFYPNGEGYRTGPVKGGYGFGDGGSTPKVRIPNDVMDKVGERWVWAGQWTYGPTPQPLPMDEVYGCSGGGSSALLIDGEVIAVAGGGGGVSVVGKSYTVKPNDPHFPGIVDVRMTGPEHPTHAPVYSAAGVAGGARGGDATEGHEYYAQDLSLELTVEGGKGGGGGIGGAGGAKPTVMTGTPNSIFSFDSQNKQVLYSSSTAGNPGTNGLQGNGGDGVMSVSYQLDNHSLYGGEYETLKLPDGTHKYLSYYQVAPYFNGAQIIVSGGGGGGYGGGGSGAALSQSAITIAQKWNNNPQGIRQSVSSAQVAGAGGAGGSYLAPSVIEGEISLSNNADNYSEYGTGGTATVYLCEVPW